MRGRSKFKSTCINTSIRGIPRRVKDDYRLMAAQLVKDTGKEVSMNDLFIKALTKFIDKPEHQVLVHK